MQRETCGGNGIFELLAALTNRTETTSNFTSCLWRGSTRSLINVQPGIHYLETINRLTASLSLREVHLSRWWLITVAGVLLLILAIMAGLHWREITLVGHDLQIASKAFGDGRMEDATLAVDRSLRLLPNSAEAHYLKARIAWAQNDLFTAEQELARARAIGYEWAPFVRLSGLLLARAKKTSEAETLLRQALVSSSDPDPEVKNALTRLYLETFQLGEAAALLDQWMHELPHDARPYLLRVEIDKRSQAQPEVIIARYRAALDRDPSLHQARFGLAGQLRLMNRYVEAAVEYNAYLSVKPDDPLGLSGAGQNALELGDLGEAIRLLDRALSFAAHDPEILAARATIELRQSRWEAALDYINQAVAADPFDHGNRYQRMLIFSRLGKKDEAVLERQAVDKLKTEQARFSQIRSDLLRNPLDPKLRSEAGAGLWNMVTRMRQSSGRIWSFV